MAWTKENMPSFSPDIEGTPTEGLFTPTVDQKHRLGARYQDGHGRVWRYAKNGSTELAAALMTCAEAPDSGIFETVQTGYTTAIGDDRIRVLCTTGNGITDGDLLDGWLIVNKVTGLGYAHPIAGNSWISGDTVMDVQLYDSIRVATTATTEITMRKNLWNGIIVNATTPTGLPTGVPNMVIAASYYGWVQTKGPCAMTVDTDETLTIGCMCGGPATAAVAGAVGVCAVTEPFYGQAITIGATDETALINLMLE
jgi:hypothetical protein